MLKQLSILLFRELIVAKFTGWFSVIFKVMLSMTRNTKRNPIIQVPTVLMVYISPVQFCFRRFLSTKPTNYRLAKCSINTTVHSIITYIITFPCTAIFTSKMRVFFTFLRRDSLCLVYTFALMRTKCTITFSIIKSTPTDFKRLFTYQTFHQVFVAYSKRGVTRLPFFQNNSFHNFIITQ